MAIVENARHLEKNDGRTENYGLGHQNYNGGSHGKSDEKKRKMAIAAKLASQRNEEAGAGEEGTDKLVKKYKKDTPAA